MSTMHFGIDTLVNIARIVAHRDPTCDSQLRACQKVVSLSRANTRAYNNNYPGENAKPWTFKEIAKRFADMAGGSLDLQETCRSAALISYNCDHMTPKETLALQDVLEALLFAQCNAVEDREQREQNLRDLQAQGVRG